MIYLLHFERKVSGHAGHYMGWAPDGELGHRLHTHRLGNRDAARLTAAAVAQGIGFWLVRVWPGSRREERRMKIKARGSQGLRNRCPLCGLTANFAQRLPDVKLPREVMREA